MSVEVLHRSGQEVRSDLLVSFGCLKQGYHSKAAPRLERAESQNIEEKKNANVSYRQVIMYYARAILGSSHPR